MNKEVLEFCKHYKDIISMEHTTEDIFTHKLINIYKNYIFSIDLNSLEDIESVKNLDQVIFNYMEDYRLRHMMKKELASAKIKVGNNILRTVVDIILRIFDQYLENTSRNIYISRWI